MAVPAVRYLLSQFPCVVILGARQVGKTTLLKQVLPDAPFLDMERAADFERIRESPEFVLSRMTWPVVIDEAQRLPEIFSALRVVIDERRDERGRFLLSGSSSPALLRQVVESLAGRVAILELGGFSLDEVWQVPPSRFYEALASGDAEGLLACEPRIDAARLVETCITGSYPEPALRRDDQQFVRLWKENYVRTYLEQDVRTLFPGLRFDSYKNLLTMLGHNAGRLVNVNELARSLDVSQPTVKSYLAIAEGTFLWRNIPGFDREAERRITRMPKGHLRDSGLTCHMQRLTSIDDFPGHPAGGRIWEAFAVEEIIKGFSYRLIQADFYHYRTRNLAEIDLIVDTGGNLIPIEIKFNPAIHPGRLRTMVEFVEKHRSPFGIVICSGGNVEWIREKILRVPLGCL
ncbi:MAG: ATP-binding protein [Acidobacteria bacterium]|nr:ATP-binding protein [Acidobacteriota bacterium]